MGIFVQYIHTDVHTCMYIIWPCHDEILASGGSLWIVQDKRSLSYWSGQDSNRYDNDTMYRHEMWEWF